MDSYCQTAVSNRTTTPSPSDNPSLASLLFSATAMEARRQRSAASALPASPLPKTQDSRAFLLGTIAQAIAVFDADEMDFFDETDDDLHEALADSLFSGTRASR